MHGSIGTVMHNRISENDEVASSALHRKQLQLLMMMCIHIPTASAATARSHPIDPLIDATLMITSLNNYIIIIQQLTRLQ